MARQGCGIQHSAFRVLSCRTQPRNAPRVQNEACASAGEQAGRTQAVPPDTPSPLQHTCTPALDALRATASRSGPHPSACSLALGRIGRVAMLALTASGSEGIDLTASGREGMPPNACRGGSARHGTRGSAHTARARLQERRWLPCPLASSVASGRSSRQTRAARVAAVHAGPPLYALLNLLVHRGGRTSQ